MIPNTPEQETCVLKGEMRAFGTSRNLLELSFGARSRNRTGMTLRSADFESAASTDFATRAYGLRLFTEGIREARIIA